MSALMNPLDAVSERDLSLIDLALSMASATEIVLRSRPRDAAILSIKGEMVKRFVVNSDALDIDEEILRALTEVNADALTKVMPPSRRTLQELPGLGVHKAVLGGRLDAAQTVPPPLRVVDGLLEDEVEVLNRAWLKKLAVGTPYVTGLQILGLDGVPVAAGQPVDWGLEKFDIHSLLLKSGCVINPHDLPDWPGLLDEPAPQVSSIQIMGKTVDFEFIKSWPSIESLTERLKTIHTNHLVWCAQKTSVAQLASAGIMDELVTYVIPALGGRVGTHRRLASTRSERVGNGFRMEARFD